MIKGWKLQLPTCQFGYDIFVMALGSILSDFDTASDKNTEYASIIHVKRSISITKYFNLFLKFFFARDDREEK